jgi:uncharacterized protein YecE (DUF72 family)
VEKAPAFTFTLKLWQRFTHERKKIPSRQEVEIFKSGIHPLVKAGKLGGLLAQFPWSFRHTPKNREWLDRILEAFADYPLTLEVRHASWNRPEVFSYLKEHRVAFCNIDQPLFPRSMAPDSRITARIGYVRLHGQNHADWFREDAGRDDRYNYLYTEEELEPWVEKIRKMQELAERLYVITNNHYKGQAAVNALQLAHKLTGKRIEAPHLLKRAYPQLESISKGGGPGSQKNLFGN